MRETLAMTKTSFWTEDKQKLLFVLTAGIFFFYWAVIQPFNVSPDELMRYQVCQYIYEYHGLPQGGDPAIRDAVWGYSYAFFPFLASMVGAVFMWITSLFSTEPMVLVMAARMVSVLCGMGTAWFCLGIGEQIWRERQYKWMFTIFVTLLPQVSYLFSYINNDSLAILSTAIIIDGWLKGLRTGWNWRSCLQLATGIILCALSYYNAYGVILASILLFGVCLFQSLRKKNREAKLLQKGVVIAAIVLAGISWWFIRNGILYDGDILGMRTSEVYSELYGIESIKPSMRYTPKGAGESLLGMLFYGGWLKVTAMSFVGCFGYMSIPLKLWMYLSYGAVVLAGLVGAAIYLVQHWHVERKNGLFLVGMLVTAVVPNVLNLIHSYTIDFEPQGRYSMPMLLPLMYFVTMGWRGIFRRVQQKAMKNGRQRDGITRWGYGLLLLAWVLGGLASGFWIFPMGLKANGYQLAIFGG